MSLTNEKIDVARNTLEWAIRRLAIPIDRVECIKALDDLCEAARPNERQAAMEELARYMMHEFATVWSDLEDSHTVEADIVAAIEARLDKLRSLEAK